MIHVAICLAISLLQFSTQAETSPEASPSLAKVEDEAALIPDSSEQGEQFSDSIKREITDLRQNHGLSAEEALVVARELQKQEAEISRAEALRTVREQREARGEHLSAVEGYALNSAIWHKPARIPVYFQNATESELKQECQWIREAVERTWEQAADIDFTEWRPLPPGAKGGIRILFKPDAHPHTKGLGRHLDGVTSGMVLTNTFTGTYGCPIQFRACIERIAVHEFGHALGFAHEHNRPDIPSDCKRERQGSNGDNPVTIYDPRSIMNYCNTRWNNDGVLSALDKEAVVKLYGKKS